MSFIFKKKKQPAPTSPLLGATAADIAKGPEEPPELPTETDPNILEAQRQARRRAKKRRGVASTMLGGQLSDEGYDMTKTLLG